VRVRVRTEGFFQTLRLWIAGAIIFAAFVALVYALRKSPYIADPYLDNYLQMAGGLLGFTFAANALVRFKGNHDRLSLILAFGFLLSGLIEAGASVSVYRDIGLSISPLQYVSVAWMSGRTLLAVLLIAGLVIERRTPYFARIHSGNRSRHADRWRRCVSHQRILFRFAGHPGYLPSRLLSAGLGSASSGAVSRRHRRLPAAAAQYLYFSR
jgi:hypothetical protein